MSWVLKHEEIFPEHTRTGRQLPGAQVRREKDKQGSDHDGHIRPHLPLQDYDGKGCGVTACELRELSEAKCGGWREGRKLKRLEAGKTIKSLGWRSRKGRKRQNL